MTISRNFLEKKFLGKSPCEMRKKLIPDLTLARISTLEACVGFISPKIVIKKSLFKMSSPMESQSPISKKPKSRDKLRAGLIH